MPDDMNEIDKAGRVLNAANASAIQDAANAMAEAGNKLMQVLTTAGIPDAAKDDAPDEDEPMDDMPEEETAPEEKSVWRPSQQEVNYVAVSTTAGEACANCRWFTGVEGLESCHIISNWPLDIQPTGYCDRHETILLADVMPPAPEAGMVMEMEAKETVIVPLDNTPAKAMFEKLKDGALKYMGNLIPRHDKEDDTSSFRVYKDSDGTYKWLARYTNNFEDLDGDIFTEAAHDKYIARVEQGFVAMPELRLWHLRGTTHGVATKVLRDGHIVLATGTFDDSPFAQKCIAFYRKNRGRIALSQGAFVPKWARQVDKETGCRLLTDYNTFEITTLPPGISRAANPYTTFDEDMTMALKPEQKEFLVKQFGEEEAARIERENESINKMVESFGATYKDMADLSGGTTEEAPAIDKGAASLLVDLIVDQSTVLKIAEGVALKQAASDKQLAEFAASVETLTATVNALQKQLGQPPVRASEAPETLVSDVEKQAIIEKQPVEYDPAFPGMKVPMRPVSPL